MGSSPSIATKTGRISVWKSGIGTESNISYQQRHRLPLAGWTACHSANRVIRLYPIAGSFGVQAAGARHRAVS